MGGEMRRQKSLRNGVHHANGVVWGLVYRTHLSRRGFDRLLRRVLLRDAVPDVPRDRAVEHLRVLHDEADVAVHAREVERPDVASVERDGAAFHVVVPQKQRDDGGLAAAALPDERRGGPARDDDVHAAQHDVVRAHLVPERDVLERDGRAARPARRERRARPRRDVGEVVLQRKHPRRAPGGSHQARHAVRQRGVRARDGVEVQLERDQRADRESRVRALHRHPAAEPEDQDGRPELEEVRQRHRPGAAERVLDARDERRPRVLFVPRELHVLRARRAHGPDVPERLVRDVGREAEHRADLTVQRLRPPRVPLDEIRDRHHDRERYHRESPAHVEAHREAAGDDDDVLRGQGHHGVTRRREVRAVVRKPREQIAGVHRVEVRDVLAQDVLQQTGAHFKREPPPDEGEARALARAEQRDAHGRREQERGSAVEFFFIRRDGGVDGGALKVRHEQRGDGRHERQPYRAREQLPLQLREPQHAPQVLRGRPLLVRLGALVAAYAALRGVPVLPTEAPHATVEIARLAPEPSEPQSFAPGDEP
eukprot:31117-Pelagococcus_subviridis.AAC.27